ncbi:MAG: endolytic transglycosylase MltG [bacterium]
MQEESSGMRDAVSFAGTALELHFAGYTRAQALALLVALALVFSGYWLLIRPPSAFPTGSIVTVPSGLAVSGVAKVLAEDNVVAYPRLLSVILRLSGNAAHVQAGDYSLEEPLGLAHVAYRLAAGDFDLDPVRVTLPEGLTAREMGLIYARSFPEITAENFRTAGERYEGYLFPDTYLFLPNAKAADVIATMRTNFDTKVASVTPEINASGHSFSDVIIMASILEREAKTSEDKRMVARILWNRIRIGMPLQVDAVFGYIHGRDTYSPTFADLEVDSPYNTYRNKGLPPGPIGNPGLDSIEAAATPAKTADLYYLTGFDGQMHYAKTFEEHKANRSKYLR